MAMFSTLLKGLSLSGFPLICVFAGPLPLSFAGQAQDPTTLVDTYYLSGILILIAGLGIAVMGWRKEKKNNHVLTDQQEALQKSREKYKMIVERSGNGILIVQDLTIKYANSWVYEILGLEKKDPLSDHLMDYVFPDDLGLVLAHYEKTMLSLDEETGFAMRVITGDKTIRWVQVRSVCARFQGAPATLSFMGDVTGLKNMETDLQQAQRMEAIGALSGGIAHDFNNILTTILGNTELALMDVNETDPTHEAFHQIYASGLRARELVQQILTLSRSHSGEVIPLSLGSVIKEGLKLLRASLPSNIRIIETIDRDSGRVRVDPTHIYQVFMNLCTNAKHAMEKNDTGALEVILTRVDLPCEEIENSPELPAGGYVKLSVIDNGEGIHPGIRDKIFHPYFTTKAPGTGTGLGLATSRGIVEKYKGDIVCQSELGKGSEFSVFLPVHEPPSPVGIRIEDLKGRSGQGNILFVDDEKEIAIIVKKIFKTFGYRVVTAGSGQEALEHFTKDPDFFHLLITDMAMPGMTGEQLIKKVISIRPDLPVILCTGHSDTFDKQRALDAGIREYITKPYSLKDLSAMAARYVL